MSYQRWLNYIKSAEKSSIISGNVRKVHYVFSDGEEMCEDYSIDTGILIRRAWRKKRNILCGDTFDWDLEIGENASSTTEYLVKESNLTPVLSKRLTRNSIEWRIRNISFPLETYLVTADDAKKAIIVRTTNKKYYKEIEVPELNRCDLSPQQEAITVRHQYNTLIISYRKPELVQQLELDILKILQDVTTEVNEV